MATEVKIPSVGESINEVTIAQWLVEDGEEVEMDDVICELESDKATFELSAEADGVLKHKAEEGDTVEIGTVVAEIEEGASSGKSKSKDEDKEEDDKDNKDADKQSGSDDDKAAESEDGYAAGHPSPAAAKILSEKGIDPADVKGTGKDGRITKEDAEAATKKEEQKSSESKSKKSESKKGKESRPLPDLPTAGGTEEREESRQKMSSLRKTIAKRLVAAKNETAMLTTFNEVDMTNLMNLRKKYKERFKEKHEVGLGFMSFFTKAVCEAAKEYPSVNAILDGEELITHNYCDVGIAVSTPRGLVVPVIRNAQAMTLAQIEKSVLHYALKARENKVTIEDMQGGTFTITNGGVFGSMMSTPILNAPQSAILGMHNIVERPVAVDGEVKIRPVMYIALSYDHRVVDGKESVSFLKRIKEYVEDPARLLLEI